MKKLQLLSIVTVAFTLTVSTVSNICFAQFGGGNGTQASPYEIRTRQHLELLADSVNNGNNWSRNKYFKVMNDITDTVRTIIGERNKTIANAFKGNFDGQNFRIVLGINKPNNSYNDVSLFGYCDYNTTISNVITEGYVKGGYYVGGIVGMADATTTITNCINNGKISALNSYSCVGGIVGFVGRTTTTTNCINNGDIIGNSSVGGIVGHGEVNNTITISIKNCINNGDIIGNSSVGGIAGLTGNSNIENCINIGKISGTSNVGGISGSCSKIIENCINSGLIIGSSYVGGISGSLQSTNTVSNCFNSGVVIGNTYIGGIIGEKSYTTTIIVSNCYYDKQMCRYGGINNTDANGQAVGYLTNEMTGTQLQSKLGTTNFTYSKIYLLKKFVNNKI